MILRTLRRLALGLCLASIGGVASAEPTARQAELAHRYMAAMHMQATMDATMKAMLPGMLASLPKSAPAVQARQQIIAEVTGEVMHDMMGKMVVQIEPIIADTYTEQELQDVVAFYESPTGQSMIAKAPILAARMGTAMRSLMPEVQAEMRTKLGARIDCSATTGAAAKPQ